MRRRREREELLKILYEIDLKDSWDELRRGDGGYVSSTLNGIREKRKELDDILSRFSKDWPLERMAVIDRNILRIALYEMLYVPDVPPKVSINEAVELAKKYGDKDSYRFINGILDRIFKEKMGGEGK